MDTVRLARVSSENPDSFPNLLQLSRCLRRGQPRALSAGPRSFELDAGITRVILDGMKTAISIPGPIFEAADRLARRLGLSRSELYAKAVSAYLERHRQEGITAALNRVYGSNPEESRVEADVLALQEASVPRERW